MQLLLSLFTKKERIENVVDVDKVANILVLVLYVWCKLRGKKYMIVDHYVLICVVRCVYKAMQYNYPIFVRVLFCYHHH